MPLPEQARRVAQLPPYLFVEVTRKINEKRARGEDVISLAIGDPDLPSAPPHHQRARHITGGRCQSPLPGIRWLAGLQALGRRLVQVAVRC